MKECTACHEAKSESEFRLTTQRGKPYIKAKCKVCERRAATTYNLNSKDRLKEYYQNNKKAYHARTKAWASVNPDRWREIQQKSSGAYYHKIVSPLADEACQAFNDMDEELRKLFAIEIMDCSDPLWKRAKYTYKLDEWLGAYSGI